MHTEIIMLTDVSGSMAKIDRATCEGFNTFIEEQQGVPGTANLTAIRFNTAYTTDYRGPLSTAPKMRSLGASGGTALYDSLAAVITEQRHRVGGGSTQVIFVVLTDGEDLHSRTHNAQSAAGFVNAARADGCSSCSSVRTSTPNKPQRVWASSVTGPISSRLLTPGHARSTPRPAQPRRLCGAGVCNGACHEVPD